MSLDEPIIVAVTAIEETSLVIEVLLPPLPVPVIDVISSATPILVEIGEVTGPGGSSGAGTTISDTPPSSPQNGQTFWESDTGKFYVYFDDGSSAQWVQIGIPPTTVTGGGGAVLVSAIYPPSPDPVTDGTQWYDPSTGAIKVWYDGVWVPFGMPAPSAPTPVIGQTVTVSVRSPSVLIKELDLPFLDWEGGTAYYARFEKAFAAGWADPGFFPIGVFLSPGQSPHAANLAAAGVNHYDAIEANTGNIVDALEDDIAVMPQMAEWTVAEVDAEDGDDDPRVVAWHVDDEPDMNTAYGDENARLVAVNNRVDVLTARNDGRFTKLNIGNGVLKTFWSPNTVDDIVRSVDVCSVDQYAYSSSNVRNNIIASSDWPLAGVSADEPQRAATYGWLCDQMRSFQDPDNRKPYWVYIETAKPLIAESDSEWITLPQIAGAAWSSIVHGAMGVAFFQHNNNDVDPFYSISDDASTAIRNVVTELTSEISALAPVLNTPTYIWNFGDDNIDTMLKAFEHEAYIFAAPSLLADIGGGSTDIEQVGDILQYQFSSTAETGTVSSTITVSDDVELVVVTVAGYHGTSGGFASMTFTKGGVDTAMVKATGGDADGATWQSAMFYMALPDSGTNKSLKWDWTGAAADGARVVSVTFWRGIDTASPVRDSDGDQQVLVTPTLTALDGDLVLCHCAMFNGAADGSAKIDAWTHLTELEELTHSIHSEAALATATPDGDLTVGFSHYSNFTLSNSALSALVIKPIIIAESTSDITQIGSVVQTGSGGSTANTGTYFSSVTVPVGTEIVLAGVSGYQGLAGGFASLTMLKGGVQTPMIRLNGGDAEIDTWQGALFYMVEPDIGSTPIMWDWIGTGSSVNATIVSLSFWSGVDLADPVRDSDGVQGSAYPLRTPTLTNHDGDLIVAWFAGYTGGSEGAVESWVNLTEVSNLTHDGFIDGAWAAAALTGSTKVGVADVSAFTEGALCAVVLKPA